MGIVKPVGFFGARGEPNSYSLLLERAYGEYAYITNGNQTGLDMTDALTAECWVTFASLPLSGNYYYLLCKCNSGFSSGWAFYVGYSDASNLLLRMAVADGSSHYCTVTWANPSLDTWYHLAASGYTLSNTWYMQFTVNGNAQGSLQATGGGNITSNSDAFGLGSRPSSPAGRYHDGLIDDARVWSEWRGTGPIGDNYNKQLTGNETNLEGYWQLNNDLTDKTSNGNDLTPNGILSYSSSVPF